MKRLVKPLFLLLLAGLAVGCNRSLAKPESPILMLGQTGPQAWIDAPLNDMHLPLAPYEVVFHITDDSGVVQGELSVNGSVLASLPNADPALKLATLRQVWNPAGPGEYVLVARAQNAAGAWGESSPVRVVVGEVTITPTLTPTPATITPTLTPTPTPTLTPTPGSGFGAPTLSSTGFYYGYGACDPKQVSVWVGVTDPRGVKVVVFFDRLKDADTGKTTEWSDGEAMNLQSDGRYLFNLAGDAIGPSSGFVKATVLYQFVAQLKDGSNLRSPVYSDLTLGRCGQVLLPIRILPPLIPTTPAPPLVK